MSLRRAFILMSAFLFLHACDDRKGFVRGMQEWIGLESAQPPSQDFERRRWLHKTARILRGGDSLNDPKLEEELLLKSDSEIVEYFMSQPEFGDTALDFNMHFLGFRRDHVRDSDGELSGTVFDFPSAVHSAKEVLKNGDFFKLFDFDQPLFMGPLRFPAPVDPGDWDRSPETVRAKRIRLINESLDRQIEQLKANPETALEKACSDFMTELRQGYQIGESGISYSLMDIVYGSNIWYGKLVETCIGPFHVDEFSTTAGFLAELQKIKEVNSKFFPALQGFERSVYSTRKLADVKALDTKAVGLPGLSNFFGNPHRQSLQNSSTNYNRKRAAYILSRFFCDDLTPINVEPPSSGAGDGRHGSEASCMACHYKLDPMAGFFRDYGMNFGEYAWKPKIRFDDNAGMNLSDYQSAWRAPEGSSRSWNIGYIRSSSKESLNSYGSSIEDLFKLFRTEPEVKRCLVKRMFEYYVSDLQALDGGYHDYLTEIFTQAALLNSTRAFKDVTKMILLSQSYRTTDPVSDHCYDYPPGYDPAGAPPCQVAHILVKNCASCHYGTFEEPYLDLTRWRALPNGTFNFPHYDENDVQKSTAETFEKMLDRLTTSNPQKRMPLRKHMSALDREVLFKWVSGVLTEGSKSSVNGRSKTEIKVEIKKETQCPVLH